MKIMDVLEKIHYKKCLNFNDAEFESVTINSREPGDIFIGIKGENFNGSDYYQEAFYNGSKIAVVNNIEETEELKKYLWDNDKMIIIAVDTTLFLTELASYKRDLYNIPVIAVTGSAGKTSTKDFIYSVMNQKYKTLKTEGNFNNRIGVPLTLLRLRKHECAVIEMGMDHFYEIELSSMITKPTIALINNIGTAHVELLGSRENILKAKLEILVGMEDKKLIVNNDNDLLNEYAKKNKVITFGIDNKSNYMCEVIASDEYSSTIKYKKENIVVPIGGMHFVYNALAAISIGEELGVTLKQIKKGIENCELTKGRAEIIKCDGYEIISDAYNANTDAMAYAIRHLGVFKGRKIAVLGTIGELADKADEYHEMLGNVAGDSGIDIVITVGEHTEYINKGAVETGVDPQNSYHLKTLEEAIELINSLKQKNDVILVKASHFNHFEKIVEGIK